MTESVIPEYLEPIRVLMRFGDYRKINVAKFSFRKCARALMS